MFCHCCFTDGCSHLLKSLLTTIDLRSSSPGWQQYYLKIKSLLTKQSTGPASHWNTVTNYVLNYSPSCFLSPFCTHSHIFYIPKNNVKFQFSQFSHSVVSNSVNPWTAAHFPVHHKLPVLAQIHVHQVSDDIQASHPLSFPPPPAFNLSQHQDLF